MLKLHLLKYRLFSAKNPFKGLHFVAQGFEDFRAFWPTIFTCRISRRSALLIEKNRLHCQFFYIFKGLILWSVSVFQPKSKLLWRLQHRVIFPRTASPIFMKFESFRHWNSNLFIAVSSQIRDSRDI